MTQTPGPRPRLDMHGAVDLSSLGRARTPAPGGETPATDGAPGPVVDVTEAGFAQLIELSLQVPVVVAMWASWSETSKDLTADLAAAVRDLGGRIVLGRVDIDANPQIVQAFGPQAGPVVAVLKGQPVALPPLEQATPAERRAILDQLLTLAAQNGVTGSIGGGPAEPEPEPEPGIPPLPPRHQEAYDAIERDDLDAAIAAYDAALVENPRDELARVGRSQVELMRRTRDVDPQAARAVAAAEPADLAAQLVVADLDVLAGHVEDAYARLLDAVRATVGPERETARTRLVELFAVVGEGDPRVAAARRALAAALF